MKITFKRVLGVRSQQPCVLAVVDGDLVRWLPREGWTCTCVLEPCPHVDAVAALLEPSVLGGGHG